MHLLNVNTLSLETFNSQSLPKYVIVSHVHGDDEAIFLEAAAARLRPESRGGAKVHGFAQYIRQHIPGIEWLWIDTCCLNRDDPDELDEAIPALFSWYQNAEVCIAYLDDVEYPDHCKALDERIRKAVGPDLLNFTITSTLNKEAFKKSAWFQRCWTLPELLAPRSVVFLNRDWQILGHRGGNGRTGSGVKIKTGLSLCSVVSEITGIPTKILLDFRRLFPFALEDVQTWMYEGVTRHEEDPVYCLLGMFNVRLRIRYGEGLFEARSWFHKAWLEARPGQEVANKEVFKLSPSQQHALPAELFASSISDIRDTRYQQHGRTGILDGSVPSASSMSSMRKDDQSFAYLHSDWEREGEEQYRFCDDVTPPIIIQLVDCVCGNFAGEETLRWLWNTHYGLESLCEHFFRLLGRSLRTSKNESPLLDYISSHNEDVAGDFKRVSWDLFRSRAGSMSYTLWAIHQREFEVLARRFQRFSTTPRGYPRDVAGRHRIFDSHELEWFIEAVARETSCVTTGHELVTIRRMIRIGSGTSDSSILEWNPREFLNNEYEAGNRMIENSICFCAINDSVFATTISRYLAIVWPDVCSGVLQSVIDVCENNYATQSLSIGSTNLNVEVSGMATRISVDGDPLMATQIYEAYVFLATACRASKLKDQVQYCSPRLNVSSLQWSFDYTEFNRGPGHDQCWTSMVRNPVIVNGFPIPKRDHQEKGLEASVDLVIAFSQVSWAATYKDKFILKGPSSALVAVDASDTSVTWHFASTQNGARLSYNDALASCKIQRNVSLDESQLGLRRHFVGFWTTSARIRAGSRDCTLDDSGPSESKQMGKIQVSLTGFSIAASKYAGVGANFSLGRKEKVETFRLCGDDPFEWHVEQASRWPILFYGTEDRRGWLIDGATALMYLIRQWMSSDLAKDMRCNGLTRFQFIEGLGGRSLAKKALRHNKEHVMKIHLCDLECSREQSEAKRESISVYTDDDGARKLNGHSDWTFEKLAMKVLRALEALHDRTCDDHDEWTKKTIKLPERLRREALLVGFEVTDIIRAEQSAHWRDVKIPCGVNDRWIEVVRDSNAIVFFARDFGDLIVPDPANHACRRGSSVPRDRHFLAVPLDVMQLVSDRLSRKGPARDEDTNLRLGKRGLWDDLGISTNCMCAQGKPCSIVSCLENLRGHSMALLPKSICLTHPHGVAIIGDPAVLATERPHRIDSHDNQLRDNFQAMYDETTTSISKEDSRREVVPAQAKSTLTTVVSTADQYASDGQIHMQQLPLSSSDAVKPRSKGKGRATSVSRSSLHEAGPTKMKIASDRLFDWDCEFSAIASGDDYDLSTLSEDFRKETRAQENIVSQSSTFDNHNGRQSTDRGPSRLRRTSQSHDESESLRQRFSKT